MSVIMLEGPSGDASVESLPMLSFNIASAANTFHGRSGVISITYSCHV